MCGIVPRSLVVSFPQSLQISTCALPARIFGSSYVESMEDKLKRSTLPMRVGLPYSLHLIHTLCRGEENHITVKLYSWFRENPDYGLGVIHA
jgi:hypothetical protein